MGSESLKPFEAILEADPRHQVFVRIDTGKPITVEDHHQKISQFSLIESVPDDVVGQYETARNLYLYAWFFYRFYPVAQHHALTTLELALCIRLGYISRRKKSPGLRILLNKAIKKRLLKNENFTAWQDRVAHRARLRYETERRQEMIDKDLDVIELDYEHVVPNDMDRDFDYLKLLAKTIPKIRNQYAHGSTNLDNQVLHTFETVSEILNQIFESEGDD